MKQFPEFGKTDLEKSVEANLIELKKSGIPKAGTGVFAKQDIPAKTDLGYYRGEALTEEQFHKRHGESGLGSYVLTVNHPVIPKSYIYVDGEKKGNWTSRMNSPRGTHLTPNVIFYEDGTVFAKRNIKKGEELLVGYGSSYWNCGYWKKNTTRRSKSHQH